MLHLSDTEEEGDHNWNKSQKHEHSRPFTVKSLHIDLSAPLCHCDCFNFISQVKILFLFIYNQKYPKQHTPLSRAIQ